MQTQLDNINSEYFKKVEECMQNLYQAMENSFNKIDAQIDQLCNEQANIVPTSQKLQDVQYLNYHCSFQLLDDNFSKQIFQEVATLMNNSIQNEDQKKQKQHHDEQQETQPMQQHKIQEYDSQNQQHTNQQTILTNCIPFKYEFMKYNSIKQGQICNAIAVNKDCSILVAGCEKQIKVFDFNQGMMKQIQILSEHSKEVYTLNFMKKSNQFISGSYDKLIIIWARDQSNSWFCKQKLDGDTVFCLTLNNNEDLIASGSCNNPIKLWKKQNEWICSQTITDHTDRVLGLSFNEQQNRLISCGEDKLILVIEQLKYNKQWIIVQKIVVETEGLRICFIDNNTFTLYPWGRAEVHVFEVNSSNKQYQETNVIQLKAETGSEWTQFPQQYIESKCILVNKHVSKVSLIRRQQNGEFTMQQSIEFRTYQIFGCMTDDGQYLITWDQKSEEYQIRKYQEL